MYILVFAVLCCVGLPARAGVYTWVDAQGVRHYSDQPNAQQARMVDLDALQPTADTTTSGQPRTHASTASAAAGPAQRLTIVRPEPGAELESMQGLVAIAVAIDGGLGANEQLVYFLDGRTVANSPTRTLQFKLTGLSAGPHALQVALVVAGREASRTEPLAFTVKLVPAAADNTQQKSRTIPR